MSLDINRLIIGKVVGVHGVKGLVKLISFTEKKDNIFNYSPYYLGEKKIEKIHFRFKIKDMLICEIRDCRDRNTAQKLVNQNILIDRSKLPALKNEEEFYQHDLVGYKIKNVKSEIFGCIHKFHDFGAGLICEVKKNNKSYYLPFQKNFLLKVNMQLRTVILDLPIEIIND